MNSWFDDSDQEYGIDTHGMKLFSDESFECEIPMDSISKETLAELIGYVPIIRCKDCKYFQSLWNESWCSRTRIRTNENRYCSSAERKDE